MNNNKLEHWKQVAEQWRQSGKNQKDFCKEREIKLTTLHYWMGRIKKAEKDNSQIKDLVCISMPEPSVEAKDIVLEIDQRYRINLPQSFNPETLRQILAVIG